MKRSYSAGVVVTIYTEAPDQVTAMETFLQAMTAATELTNNAFDVDIEWEFTSDDIEDITPEDDEEDEESEELEETT